MGHYRTTEVLKTELAGKSRRALIVTTVKHESRAVRSHLVDREQIVGSNQSIYDFGRYSEPAGDWDVVQAICQAGNNDAAAVTTKAFAEFGKFDVVMFVGIAGSLKDDIPIGNVIAGDYVYNAHSAKEEDNETSSRPHALRASHDLIQAANFLLLDEDWVDLIKAPHRTILPPVSDYPCPWPPEAHIKAIASGEQVVAGGKGAHYNMIRQRLNDAGAVEMEGYGTMTAAHQENASCIIIRGISDMCAGKDSEADKNFQPIASAHAAAFAFSILSVRSRATPSGPDGVEAPIESLASKALPAEELEDERVDFILNFMGNRSEWTEARVQQVIDCMREFTGDPNLELVRIEEGSVRVVVSVRKSDVQHLTLETTRSATDDEGESLLGAVTSEFLPEAEAAKVALKDASVTLLNWEKTLPGGGWLDRPERAQLEANFALEYSTTIVLGEPGAGKSALLATVATSLIDASANVFGLKADFLSTNVGSEADLQKELDLPSLPSELLLRLARLEPVYVFIDQLDALASQLDLHSDRLNVLLNLIRKLGRVPNVHVICSARTFEFNHDVRLRAIDAESLILALPAWTEVKEKLDEAHVDADNWPENARNLIRNPQHLKTYLSLSRAGHESPFSTYQSMLEQLWRQKIVSTPNSEALAALATELAGTMAEEEALWLAASRYDGQAAALEGLEAIGLIVRSENGKSVAFSHQTIFDYVLARNFVRTIGRLSSYVLERQNSLFVRPKLWSSLRYLRDSEVGAYEREITEIWSDTGLRRHLRLLLIEFLGELADPLPFEKLIIEGVMQNVELRPAGIKAIAHSPGWFTNFARTVIPDAMTGNDAEMRLVLRILEPAWSFADDEVIRLVYEKWLPNANRDSLTWALLQSCPSWSNTVEDMAHTILARSPITVWHVDYTASVLAVEQKDAAFRLVRTKLSYLLACARKDALEPYPESGSEADKANFHQSDRPTEPIKRLLEERDWNSLPAMAEEASESYLKIIWPWLREAFEELKIRVRGYTLDHLYVGQYDLDLGFDADATERLNEERPLLTSLCTAIENVASDDQQAFLKWVEENSGVELMGLQRLIAHGFAHAPSTYWQEVYDWIRADNRRLQLGNSSGMRRTTERLVRAVSPFWTDEQITAFEAQLLAYRPTRPTHFDTPELRKNFSDFIRSTKAHLLSALPTERLAKASRDLIETEKRALGQDLDRGVRHHGPGFIGSPMEADAMARAKDRDILKIFDEVPDDTDWDHPKGWMRGGNIQLSRAFATFAKDNVERALEIIGSFHPKKQERAAGYALDAMADLKDHDVELQEALLALNERGFSTSEFRSSAASTVEKISQRSQTADAVIDTLASWLEASAGNEEDERADSSATKGDGEPDQQSDDQSSILWGHGGISILPRGNFPALSALCSALLKRGDTGRNRLIEILNDHLPREKDIKVWRALLLSLTHAGGSTPEIVSKFLRKLIERFPTLVETREAVYFLAYAQRWDETLVHDVIKTWAEAENPMLRQAQGEIVGLVATVQEAERWIKMREELLENGTTEAKVGLAYSAANLWREDEFHKRAGELLVRLVPKADKARIAAIVDVFRISENFVPDPITISFLRALATENFDFRGTPSTFIVEKLQSILPHEAETVGKIALKLVEAWREELGESRSNWAPEAPQLTDLSITLHRLGGDSREVGVSLFETLIDLDADGARETLQEIDGRFGTHAGGRRPRISRRAKRRSRRAANK